MTRAQGKHREFSLNQSVATLKVDKCGFNVLLNQISCSKDMNKCKYLVVVKN